MVSVAYTYKSLLITEEPSDDNQAETRMTGSHKGLGEVASEEREPPLLRGRLVQKLVWKKKKKACMVDVITTIILQKRKQSHDMKQFSQCHTGNK